MADGEAVRAGVGAGAQAYALDFRLSDLSFLLSQCEVERGQIGFGIGHSELCFLTFELPLPKQFGALCVLPSSIFDVEHILDENLAIFVFSCSSSSGMKMTSRCDISLKPQEINNTTNLESSSTQSMIEKTTLTRATFKSFLYNSIGVGTMNGEIIGSISLLRITNKPVKHTLRQPVVIPPLLLPVTQVESGSSRANSHSEDSLLATNPSQEASHETFESYAHSPVEPIHIPTQNFSADDDIIASPLHSRNIKHSLRYDLTVTEPEALQHFIEVDDIRMSQSTVDVVNMKPASDILDDEDRSQVPWCLSLHYQDSHSLRVQGENPPIPVYTSAHRSTLLRNSNNIRLSDDRPSESLTSLRAKVKAKGRSRNRNRNSYSGGGRQRDETNATLHVKPARVPRVARRYASDTPSFLRGSLDFCEAVGVERGDDDDYGEGGEGGGNASYTEAPRGTRQGRHLSHHSNAIVNRTDEGTSSGMPGSGRPSFSRVDSWKENTFCSDDNHNHTVSCSMERNSDKILSGHRESMPRNRQHHAQPSVAVPGLAMHKFQPMVDYEDHIPILETNMQVITFQSDEPWDMSTRPTISNKNTTSTSVITATTKINATATNIDLHPEEQPHEEEPTTSIAEKNFLKYSTRVENNYTTTDKADSESGSDHDPTLTRGGAGGLIYYAA